MTHAHAVFAGIAIVELPPPDLVTRIVPVVAAGLDVGGVDDASQSRDRRAEGHLLLTFGAATRPASRSAPTIAEAICSGVV